MTNGPVLVVGAGGALGLEIVKALREQGHEVTGSYRRTSKAVCEGIEAADATLLRLVLEDEAAVKSALEQCSAAIFTPILTVSAQAARLLRPDQRAVFFSSNNVAIDPQAEVYAKLLAKEAEVKAAAPQAVILRPTMIYGYRGDGNLGRLITAMRKHPVTPMPSASGALQQPVYYKDLGRIAARALFDDALAGETRAVAGPASVTTAGLYEAAKAASGAKTMLVPVPTGFLAGAAAAVERARLKLPVSAAQLSRVGRDKVPQGLAILGETPLADGLKALAETL